MNSILDSIKKMLGVEPINEDFDEELVLFINSGFMDLQQLGVGPVDSFSIEDNTKVWTDFLGTDINLASVKPYVFLKVKMLFDPPASSTVLEAFTREISEMEFRLKSQAERGLYISSVDLEERYAIVSPVIEEEE
jgi:hypothetical protein